MLFQKYKKVEQKPGGHLFAIGDIHGCLDELILLLNKIAFDETRDQVVFVDDLADRGSKNIETIQYVLSKPCFHLVAGNHEELLVEHITQGRLIHPEMMEYWIGDDGTWIRDIDKPLLQSVAKDLMAKSFYIIEAITTQGGRVGVTHAGYFEPEWFSPEKNYEDLYFRRLMWVRKSAESQPNSLPPVKGIDFTVHGHTIFREPRMNGNAIFIDTGCCIGGKLTALDLGIFAQSGKLDEHSVHSTMKI